MDGWKIVVSGSAKDLETDYHFYVTQSLGAGMAPIENVDNSLGLLDGALFQRTRTNVRTFTLAGILAGSSVTGLHADRKKLIDAVKPDRSASQQPVIVQYTGAGSTLQASAFYDAGLELADVEVYQEKLGLRFIMFDPYFEKTTSTSVALNQYTTIEDANFIIMRNASGVWQAMDGGVSGCVHSITSASNGDVYVGGFFETAGSITAQNIARWNGTTWAAVGGGLNDGVYALTIDGAGNLYAGGRFNLAGGATTACFIAKWNGSAWVALDNGLRFSSATQTSAGVYDIALDSSGTIHVCGLFDTTRTSTACHLAKWTGTTWAAVGSGLTIPDDLASGAYAVRFDRNDNLYIGGSFLRTTAASTTASRVALWDGSEWSAMGNGFDNAVNDLLIGSDGVIYAAGRFIQDATATRTFNGIARWTGTIWESLSTGVSGDQGAGIPPAILTIVDDGEGGIVAGGRFEEAGNLAMPDGLAHWTGTTWAHYEGINLPGTANIRWIHEDNGNLYIGFGDSGTASTAAVTAVTNNGTADTFPVVTIAGSGRIYHLRNLTNETAIYFNLSLQSGEVVTLDTRPGKKTLTSSIRGNIVHTVAPTSLVSQFRLSPGANNISVFMQDSSASVTMSYTERFWSIDGGAA